MQDKYGEDWQLWAANSYRANFAPFRKGTSMVCELNQDNGSWTACAAERVPEALDDCVKGHHAEFYLAQKDLTQQ